MIERMVTNQFLQQSRSRLVVLLVVLGVAVFAWAGTAVAEPAELQALVRNGVQVEYPVPGNPLNLAIEAPGRIWFTVPHKDAVAALVVTSQPDAPVVSYLINYFGLPAGSEPWDIVYSNGAVWFTQRGANKIGRIETATGELTEYAIPTPASMPNGITAAPNGLIWFLERDGKKLGRLDPESGNITEYPFPATLFTTDMPLPRMLTMRSNETIWFTAPGAGAVVTFNVNLERFRRVNTGFLAEPSHIVLSPDNRPWLTAAGVNLLGVYAPGTLTLWTSYGISTEESVPAGIAFRNAGDVWEVWFAQNAAGRVGRLTVRPNGAVVQMLEYKLDANSRPWDIQIDENQSVWVAESGRATITELRSPYAVFAYLPYTQQ
jgi:virginiamycin B lyase